MAEGDFGLLLPATVEGITFGENDSLKFTFKDTMNGETILEKDFSEAVDNTVQLVFTEEESELFPVGSYVYRLDWYQAGSFMCNIIEAANFKVVDKA